MTNCACGNAALKLTARAIIVASALLESKWWARKSPVITTTGGSGSTRFISAIDDRKRTRLVSSPDDDGTLDSDVSSTWRSLTNSHGPGDAAEAAAGKTNKPPAATHTAKSSGRTAKNNVDRRGATHFIT